MGSLMGTQQKRHESGVVAISLAETEDMS